MKETDRSSSPRSSPWSSRSRPSCSPTPNTSVDHTLHRRELGARTEVTMTCTIYRPRLFTSIAATTLSLAACTSGNQTTYALPPPLTARVRLTNLVENTASTGVTSDDNLVDPWGVALSSAGALW